MAKGEQIPEFADQAVQVTNTVNGPVFPGPAILLGIWVSATTAGTLQLSDPKLGVLMPVSTLTVGWNPFPCKFPNGITAVGGGTLTATLLIENP